MVSSQNDGTLEFVQVTRFKKSDTFQLIEWILNHRKTS